MKKHIFLLIFTVLLSSFSSKAQIKKGSFKKIRAFKIAYLTDKLNLTESEAQNFWPIYNKYNKKMMELHREERFNIRKKILSNGGIDHLSEEKSKEIFNRIQYLNKQKHEIKTVFHDKISKILSFKKILTLEVSEHDFNRKLMGKHRGKRRKNKKEAK